MKHVTSMGAVWRMSDRNFAKLQRELRDTGCVEDLDRYGKVIVERLYTIDELKETIDELKETK